VSAIVCVSWPRSFTRLSTRRALNSFHWTFMAQPYDLPEQFLAGKERYYIEQKLTTMGIGKGGFRPETIAEYRRCCTPEQLHAVCEDYRDGATIDFDMDCADVEAGHTIQCRCRSSGDLESYGKMFDPRLAGHPIRVLCPTLPPAAGIIPSSSCRKDVCGTRHTLFVVRRRPRRHRVTPWAVKVLATSLSGTPAPICLTAGNGQWRCCWGGGAMSTTLSADSPVETVQLRLRY
jgi:hypothetical protein